MTKSNSTIASSKVPNEPRSSKSKSVSTQVPPAPPPAEIPASLLLVNASTASPVVRKIPRSISKAAPAIPLENTPDWVAGVPQVNDTPVTSTQLFTSSSASNAGALNPAFNVAWLEALKPFSKNPISKTNTPVTLIKEFFFK